MQDSNSETSSQKISFFPAPIGGFQKFILEGYRRFGEFLRLGQIEWHCAFPSITVDNCPSGLHTIYEYSMSGKWLELLKEIAPRVTRAAVLREVGQKKAVAIAVRNVSGRRRWSKLQEWLRPNPSLSRQIGVAS
jgi:hypothetical protein